LIFNTGWFLLFFLLFYVIFWLVPTPRWRFWYVLGASAIFHYHFAGPAGVRPIIVMALFTFGFGLWLSRLPEGSVKKRAVFATSLLCPVAGLVYYKYRGLVFSSVPFLQTGATAAPSVAGAVALPLALSFFTFEFVHYLTDVYHGSRPIRDPFRFAFFSIFFPSIVSGPIKRFQPFLAQVEEGIRLPAAERVARGAAQVLVGFVKKLVVADNAALLIGLVESHPSESRTRVLVLMGLLSVRILFDFSGYSDIAIGLGRMLGLDLPPNFRFPYAARNISDFWQRWHISLSSWIRDYIYIPLGGGHSGFAKKVANLSVTMFLCGLWHGARWHFGIWGLYHGMGLGMHSVWERSRLRARLAGIPGGRLAGVVATDLFVAYGWLLFFYPVDRVLRFTRILFHGSEGL
jgi:alginate O-acetyltransferase complex protein AlgI